MRKALVLLVLVFGLRAAWADDGSGSEGEHGSAEEHHEGSAAPEEHHEGSGSAVEDHHVGSAAAAPVAEHHEPAHDPREGTAADPDKDHDGIPDTQEEDYDAGDPPTDPYDDDGDGVVSAEELALEAEDKADFADIPDDVDEKTLDGRHGDDELKPSLSIEAFQKLVRITKKIVLAKMEKKIAYKAAKKMQNFSLLVVGFSALGLLLLFMPLALRKKYPGKGGMLFKYSALASIVFIVTVNLFGGVIYGYRTVQGAVSNQTNPSIAIAAGTFDTLDDNAGYFITMGKELFAPTLDQMKKHPDEQPGALILENGVKVVKDAKVFISIAKLFKKIDFLLAILPIILMGVTLLLFVLALRPTLTEIVKLPATAAAGDAAAGRDVTSRAFKRVFGEMKATVCTIAVLVAITLLSGVILGFVVKPAIMALLDYFALAVSYLQYVEGASSGTVFLTLFGVILFLVLNLASLILSMAFFLGKCQKIFQARFNDGTPIKNHARFFKWGIPSVLLVQLFPLLFILVAEKVLDWLNNSSREGITNAANVPWTKLLLAGPIFLVAGYLVMFWAFRGIKAIRFLFSYKVKPKAPKAS